VIRDREKFLEELVKGKVVLHGGCVDSGVLMERINAGEFLHDRLLKTAHRVIGVDLNCEGIELMKELGYSEVYCTDLESWRSSQKFDIIVMGEIIEHVDNCGAFLKSIASFCTPETRIVFTTPNSYYYLFWIYTLFGKESIHPDHNYLFSYNSLKSLLGKFGYEVASNHILWEGVKLKRQGDAFGTKFLKSIAAVVLNI